MIRHRLDATPRGRTSHDEVLTSLHLMYALAEQPEPTRIVRIFSPAPTLAFSRRETRLPRFAEAVRIARDAGFEPVVRPTGGRAVALDPGWLVLDVLTAEAHRLDNKRVFLEHSRTFVSVLRSFGVDARPGSVSGEYCPGDDSVNARGAVKLVGTAQRVARGVRLYSASLPLRVTDAAATVLAAVNTLLDLEWDPATLGSLAHEAAVDDATVTETLIMKFAGTNRVEHSLEEVLRLQ